MPGFGVSPMSTHSSRVICLPVADGAEAALHHRIRHHVFVVEQGVFAGSDLDAHDADSDTIKVLAWVEGVPAGAVRLYSLEDGLWQGDRLAVLPPYRARALGRPLVRFAVASAACLGGREMRAHVQVANVRFFERLGWECRGGVEDYVGLPHQPMAIALAGAPVPVSPPVMGLRSPAPGRSPARR
jgi:putative N-acetyltransferase (TIGR04045 family)